MFSFFKKKKNRDKELTTVAIEFLLSQLLPFGKNPNNLPSKAREKYSLGYIAGVIDATFERASIKSEERKLQSMFDVCIDLFGHKNGQKVFSDIENYLLVEDGDFYEAMSDGGTEFIKHLNKQVLMPSGWVNYLYDLNLPSEF